MIKRISLLLLLAFATACKDNKVNTNKESQITNNEPKDAVKVIPISHGSLILEADNEVIYIDPTGGTAAYTNQKAPTAIFITDIHGDHLSTSTLEALNVKNIPVVAPKAVLDKLPSTIASNTMQAGNNEDYQLTSGLNFSVVPMYNLREEALKFHPKGRGNGYILNLANQKIYISGDTEDIPEMRNLKDIDKAFICMNLPYTMPVANAANAVLDFKPKQVYPYHYRGTNGLSDVSKFKSIVNASNTSIEVVQLNWYPN